MLKVNTVPCSGSCPETLYISWLEYQPFMKLHMEEQLFSIIDQIKARNIKYLVFDPTSRQQAPSDEDFIAFFELFLSGLSDTRLEKFARISVCDPGMEAHFQKFLNEIKENIKVPFQMRNFVSPEEANKWICPEVQHTRSRQKESV